MCVCVCVWREKREERERERETERKRQSDRERKSLHNDADLYKLSIISVSGFINSIKFNRSGSRQSTLVYPIMNSAKNLSGDEGESVVK